MEPDREPSPPFDPSRTILPITSIRRLGLLGGTFDPIHRGHLALAEYAMEHLPLDQVWFIPSARPPHKTRRIVAPPDIRWEMTRKAVEPYEPRFVPVNIELRRAGFSFTVHTIAEIRRLVGADVELFWVIGRDNVSEIPNWHRPRQLVALAAIVAGGRPGAELPEEVPAWLSPRLILLDGPNVAISSTRIREQAKMGILDPEALPEPVMRIIEREGLYGYPGLPTKKRT